MVAVVRTIPDPKSLEDEAVEGLARTPIFVVAALLAAKHALLWTAVVAAPDY